MAVKIRLRRMGTRGKPFYRMVVADSRSPRNGRFIDLLGHYDPRTEPPTLKIDEEKALLWLNRGAQPSDTVEALLKKENIFQKFLASKEKVAKKPPAVAETAPAPEEPETEPAKPPTRRKTTAASSSPSTTRKRQPKAAGTTTTTTRKRQPKAAAEKQAVEEESQAVETKAAQEEQPSE